MYKLAGILGTIVAIIGTVIPPFLIISIISFCYNAFRSNYFVSQMLEGMQAEHKIFKRYCNWSISGRDHSKRNERKRMSIGRYRINKSFNRMEEFCGKTDFLKGRNL